MNTLKSKGVEKAGGVLHCFAEDWRIAQLALEIEFYISFSSIVTFKSAPLIQEVARKAPLDRILVETDSPILVPVSHRGRTNTTDYTRHKGQFAADLRGISLEELSEATTDIFFKLFETAKKT